MIVAALGRLLRGALVLQILTATLHPLALFRHDGGRRLLDQLADTAVDRRTSRERLVLGLIANQHPLVIAKDHAVVGGGDQIVRQEWNLAAAVWRVDTISGNRQ